MKAVITVKYIRDDGVSREEWTGDVFSKDDIGHLIRETIPQNTYNWYWLDKLWLITHNPVSEKETK